MYSFITRHTSASNKMSHSVRKQRGQMGMREAIRNLCHSYDEFTNDVLTNTEYIYFLI